MSRLANFLILWLISIGLGLAAEPGGEIVSPKKVKITASAPKYNKNTGLWDAYVTLKNKTRGKNKQDVYGPFTLVLSVVKRSDVVMTNSSGQTESGQPYLALSIPSDTLVSGQKIKKIPLHFFTPTKKKFKVKYQLYGYLTPQTAPQITSISPAQSASGSMLTIKGSGFTPSSHVFFNNTALVNPEIISSEEIHVSVPFDANEQGQLIPLAAGTYPLKVDGSADHNVTVTDLPQNPNPAGTVINELVITLAQSLTQLRPDVEEAITELRSLNAANPDALAVLDQLYSLLDLTNTALQQELPNLIGTLDSTSLDTLERVLLNNGLDTVTAQLAANSSAMGNIPRNIQERASMVAWRTLNILSTGLLGKNAYARVTDGNQWLIDRKSSAAFVVEKLLKLSEPLGKGCENTAVALAFALECTAFDIISTAAETFVKLALWANGEVGDFSIKGSQITIGDQHNFDLSNIDNPNAYYSNPTIKITHNIDILLPIRTMVKLASSTIGILKLEISQSEVVKIIWDKFVGNLDKSKDIFTFSDDEGTFPINLDKVEFNNCDINITDSLSKYLYIDISSEPIKALIKVLDPPKSIPLTTTFPIQCDIGVKAEYLTDEEKSIVDKSDYLLSWYLPVKLNKTGSGTGSVVSSPMGVEKPELGITAGIDCPSDCTEEEGYFYYNPSTSDANSVKTVTLTATADSGHVFTGWSGPDAGNCPVPAANAQGGTCALTMDGKEKNITATFENNLPPPPDIVGTWNAAYWGGDSLPFNSCDKFGCYTFESYTITLSGSNTEGDFCDTQTVTNDRSNSTCGEQYQNYNYKYEYTYDPSSPYQQIIYLSYKDNDIDLHNLILTWNTDHWVMNWDFFTIGAIKN